MQPREFLSRAESGGGAAGERACENTLVGRSRRILLITYMFPPAGGIAVQRALSFARYLPEAGVDVEVLTARNPAVPVIDPGLLDKVPPQVQIHRTFTPEISFAMRQRIWRLMSGGKKKGSASAAAAKKGAPANGRRGLAQIARSLLTPDPEVVWVPFARRAAARLLKERHFDAVMITAPPFSTLMTGPWLKKRFPHIRLISDFRDEWLNFYLNTFDFHSSPSIRRKAAVIERDVVDSSDLILSVTPGIVAELQARYPHLPASRFACIPNGYDPASFRDFRPRPHGLDKVVITHAGTVYKSSAPAAFLDALDALPEEIRQRFEIRFVGRVSDDVKSIFAGRRANLRFFGFLPQAEALKTLEETDYLMVTLLDTHHVTGKLFEYLATAKPILAFTPAGGELTRLMAETGMGQCADPADAAACVDLLLRAEQSQRTGGPFCVPCPEAIRRYERPAHAVQLAALLADAGG